MERRQSYRERPEAPIFLKTQQSLGKSKGLMKKEVSVLPLLDSFCEKLKSVAKEDGSFLSVIGYDLQQISATLSTIRPIVGYAEVKQAESSVARYWLRELEDVADEMNSVLDNYAMKGIDSDVDEDMRRSSLSSHSLKSEVRFRLRAISNRLEFIRRSGMRFHKILKPLHAIKELPQPEPLPSQSFFFHEIHLALSAPTSSRSFSMHISEAKKIIFSRIQTINSKNATKIMDLLLIQKLSKKKMIRLAFTHEYVFRALVLKAEQYLGLLPLSSFTPTPTFRQPLFRLSSTTPSLTSLQDLYFSSSTTPLPYFLDYPDLLSSTIHFRPSLQEGERPHQVPALLNTVMAKLMSSLFVEVLRLRSQIGIPDTPSADVEKSDPSDKTPDAPSFYMKRSKCCLAEDFIRNLQIGTSQWRIYYKDFLKLLHTLFAIQSMAAHADRKPAKSEAVGLWLQRVRDVTHDAMDVLDMDMLKATSVRYVVTNLPFNEHSMIESLLSNEQSMIELISDSFNQLLEECPSLHLEEEGDGVTKRFKALIMTEEVLVSPLLDSILENLKSVAKESNSSLSGIDENLQKISAILSTVRPVVEVAEQKQAKSSVARSWLWRLKDVAYDLDDVLDDYMTEALNSNVYKHVRRSSLSSLSSSSFELVIRRKLNEVVGRLDEVTESCIGLHLKEGGDGESPFQLWERLQASLLVDESEASGRHDDREKIIELLSSEESQGENVSSISVVGMGGLRKTTVAQLAYNDERREKHLLLRHLRSSYYQLPAHVRKCLAFCSMFPKDYEFEKDELVLLWMAEGFIQPKETKQMEEIGDEYFNDLLRFSFFQSFGGNKSRYRMHEFIHSLVQSVSGEECFMAEDGRSCDISERALHAYLVCHSLEPKFFKAFYKASGLRTFLLRAYNKHPQFNARIEQIVSDVFMKLRCLRVLDLSHTEITELPDSVGNLKHLRYLNLSRTHIKRLPESTSTLLNLQTLKLDHCFKLIELPMNMRNLINLRHLCLDMCLSELIRMPPGIGRLTCLQTLPYFVVGRESGYRIREVMDMVHLCGALSISKLENVMTAEEAKEANLKNKDKLCRLELQWSHDYADLRDEGIEEEILEGLQPNGHLRELLIKNYNGTKFSSWLMDSKLDNLVKIELLNCRNCKVLPPLGGLPCLKDLYLKGMHGVNTVGHDFYVKGVKWFPSLERMVLCAMADLEEWFGAEGEFTCLRELRICYCPKLKKFSFLSPTTLVKLEIRSCVGLTAIPSFPSLHDLKIKDCGQVILSSLPRLTSLVSLTISQIPELTFLSTRFLQPLKLLGKLKIKECDELKCCNKEEGLQDLISLRNLEIKRCPLLTSMIDEELPITLEDLRISSCLNLTALPKGLQKLTSLQHLEISDCRRLVSLPEEGLPSTLQSLLIRGCYMLEKRCQEEEGEDWCKIKDIPMISINGYD